MTTSPLRAVRASFLGGALTVAEIARDTGLTRSTVSAALEHLERIGQVRRRREALACSGSCSGCTEDECGTTGGLVTLTLLPSPPQGRGIIAGND
ncbi:helix-turn-helix transcriptional regulator [Corynebacterium freiburgense]|uniref:helix-turn-helix transcriptional regulator n=1 Tax=Corynebacterium freiburgense TaxID=556548 RepID=UPI000422FE11|nr:helix-turn-helix domain-containing protein [Corynebacterium freiburgense]WJZ02897.1 IclR helix-turn-helix domain protein [Corynebacterium freiburgense]